jgi:hypothetical protein
MTSPKLIFDTTAAAVGLRCPQPRVSDQRARLSSVPRRSGGESPVSVAIQASQGRVTAVANGPKRGRSSR